MAPACSRPVTFAAPSHPALYVSGPVLLRSLDARNRRSAAVRACASIWAGSVLLATRHARCSSRRVRGDCELDERSVGPSLALPSLTLAKALAIPWLGRARA